MNCWIYIVKREFTLDFFLLKWSNKSENRIKRLVSKTQKYDFYLNDHSSFCIGTFCFCWLHFSIVSDFVNLFQNESFISIVLIFCSLCKRIQCTPSMFTCNTFDDMKRDCWKKKYMRSCIPSSLSTPPFPSLPGLPMSLIWLNNV